MPEQAKLFRPPAPAPFEKSYSAFSAFASSITF